MFSLRVKLVTLYFSLVLVVMIVSSTFILMTFRSNEEKDAKETLSFYATLINDEIINQSSSPEDLSSNLEIFLRTSLSAQSDNPALSYDVAILDSTGSTVLAKSSNFISLDSPVIISAANNNPSFKAWRNAVDTNGLNRQWFEYAEPGEYIVYVRSDATRASESVNDMARTLSASLFIALALAGIIGFLFSSTITKPIISLTDRAKSVADGNLEEMTEVLSDDEIGQLSKSFNYMTQELKRNIESIETEKNKIEVILHTMSDGVIAYDSMGRVIHVNSSSNDLLNVHCERYSLDKLMSNFNIALEDEEKDITLAIDDRFINLNFNHYTNYSDNNTGTLIVLSDITKHKKLDNMRKEFVANVSHELRTPLTTVKSYTQTIMENEDLDIIMRNTFLSTIDSEVDRMTFLVEDLLDLSRFDNDKMILNMQDIDLKDLVENSIIQNTVIADKKNQKIYFEEPTFNAFINGDRQRILQVFNNIISNAIKYSPEKSNINITMSLSDSINIYVRDNGIGIPREDIDRIFERFYRVDKARSRSLGGVGLGLSITKEIMNAHKGSIYAQSNLGRGTTIVISFPVKRS